MASDYPVGIFKLLLFQRQDEVRTPHQNLFEQRDTSSPEVYGNFNLPSPYNREVSTSSKIKILAIVCFMIQLTFLQTDDRSKVTTIPHMTLGRKMMYGQCNLGQLVHFVFNL